MLDKVTKACYNLFALFAVFTFFHLFNIKILKGFYQATLKGGGSINFLKQTLLSPIFRSIPFSIAIKLKQHAVKRKIIFSLFHQ